MVVVSSSYGDVTDVDQLTSSKRMKQQAYPHGHLGCISVNTDESFGSDIEADGAFNASDDVFPVLDKQGRGDTRV